MPHRQKYLNFFFSDLRARLEVAVDHMLDACSQAEYLSESETSSSAVAAVAAAANSSGLGESAPEFLMSAPQITAIARKELAPAIRDLIQHGLIQVNKEKKHFRTLALVAATSI